MTETNEEDRNIDDLIDYNDFDSRDLESYKDDHDSFHKDMLKIYEDHKKSNCLKNEVNNAQRPVSSYQRLLNTDNSKKDDYNLHISLEKDQREEGGLIYDSNEINDIIKKLDAYIVTNGIELNQFIDDLNIFLNFSDFRELLKKFRIDLNIREIRILFDFNNPNRQDGYIFIKNFVNNANFNFKMKISDTAKNNFKIIKINEEFKILHNDICDIMRKDVYDTNLKRLKLKSANLRIKNSKDNPSNNIISNAGNNIYRSKVNLNRPWSSTKRSLNMNNSQNSKKKVKELPKLNVKQHLIENIQKEKVKENDMKLNMYKREKEFIQDCVKKVSQANQMADSLQLNKVFSLVSEEDGKIICELKEFSKSNTYPTPLISKLDLKAFLVQWRIINKAYNHSQQYLFNQDIIKKEKLKSFENGNSKTNINEIHLQIKKLLVNTIRLKMKLKEQVRSLKHKIIIDEKLILENLKLSDL